MNGSEVVKSKGMNKVVAAVLKPGYQNYCDKEGG